MKENFDKAVAFTLSWEQWKSDDAGDPGGMTIWGIASTYWPDHVARMKSMNEQDAKEYAKDFYWEHFWQEVGCDGLSSGLDMVVFDTAVNCGENAVFDFLHQTQDWKDLLMLRIQKHCDRAKKTPQFLRGWLNRCCALYRIAKGTP